jgi:hypothetical protein
MNYFNLILISTHQDDKNIYNLLKNLDSENLNIKVFLLIVSQNCKINYIVSNVLNLTIQFIQTEKMGLSKARNIGLNYLINNNVKSEYIMFPDDDTSFDDNFIQNFKQILGSNKCYITPIYNEGTKNLYLGKFIKPDKLMNEKDHQYVGSPNQIILYSKFINFIYFDENLGVGTINGSCEDLDLYFRLNRTGAKFYSINKLYSYHPSKKSKNKTKTRQVFKRYKSYSLGYFFLMKKYNKTRFIFPFLIRPIFGSFYNLIFLNLKMINVYVSLFFFRLYLVLFKFKSKNNYNNK